ncbi:MAG: hypothetical protein ACKOGJ_01940 [Phycisphaerales bacterium]
MIRNASILAATHAALIAPAALAQHADDIGLVVEDGRIHSVPVTKDGFGPPQRAFEGEFGADGVPWFAGDPGYDAEPGTFPVGSRVGVRFAAPLMVWDGTSFVATSPDGAMSGERLRLSYLSLAAMSGSGPAPGFDLAVQPDGGWHIHPSMELLAAPGAAEPDTGVYLVQVEIYSTDAAIAASESIWLVLNAGATEAEHEAAYEHARDIVDPSNCAADLNGDRAVDGNDLGLLLAGWGNAGATDLNADGVTDGNDLGLLLAAWGPCP